MDTFHDTNKMTAMRAVAIVNGLEEADDEAEVMEAWQMLVDTGMAWQLPGSIGREAASLISAGLIEVR